MHPVAPRARVKTQKATHNQSALVGIIEGAALPPHRAVRLCLTVRHSSPFFPEAKPQEKNLGGTVCGKAEPYRSVRRRSRIGSLTRALNGKALPQCAAAEPQPLKPSLLGLFLLV